jgi:hypothetical protein
VVCCERECAKSMLVGCSGDSARHLDAMPGKLLRRGHLKPGRSVQLKLWWCPTKIRWCPGIKTLDLGSCVRL